MDKLLSILGVSLVAAVLSLLLITALDREILQNNRDLESFRSQGFSISFSISLSPNQGEGSSESIGSLTNTNTIK